MKPKIGVVFPKITDKDIAVLEIEKIRVSKNRRKIGILLGSDTSAYQQAKVESEVPHVFPMPRPYEQAVFQFPQCR